MIVDHIDYTPATLKDFVNFPVALNAFADLPLRRHFRNSVERQFLKEERPTIVCASMRQMIITLLREVTLLITGLRRNKLLARSLSL